MADNTELNSMTGGDNIGADEILSVKYQRIKLITGADGVNDGDVASGNPLPVDIISEIPAGTKNIGDVDVASSALPTGAATSAKQLADDHNVTVSNPTADPETGLATSDKQLADDHNVTVTSTPIDGAVNGPAEPTIDSYTQFAINLGAGADQELVATPGANKQIWVYAVTYTCSEAGTVSFQDEDDTAITGIMDHAGNSGLGLGASGNFAMPLWKVATNKALEVDVVTASIDGFISYAIVSV